MVPVGGGLPRPMPQRADVIAYDDNVLVKCLKDLSNAAALQFQIAQQMQEGLMTIVNELEKRKARQLVAEEEPAVPDFLRVTSGRQAFKPSFVEGMNYGNAMGFGMDVKLDGAAQHGLSSANIGMTTTQCSFPTSLSDEVDQSAKPVNVGDESMTTDVTSDRGSGDRKQVPMAECMLSAAKGKEKDDDDEDDDDDDDDEDYEEEEEDEDDKAEGGEEEDVEGEEEDGEDDGEDEGETEDNGEGEDDDGEDGDEEDMDGDEDGDEEQEGEDGDEGEDEDDDDAEAESEEEVPEVEPPKKKRK